MRLFFCVHKEIEAEFNTPLRFQHSIQFYVKLSENIRKIISR